MDPEKLQKQHLSQLWGRSVQGIDCCKVRKLSEFTANFLSKGKIKAIPRLSHMYSLFLFFIIFHCTRRSTYQAFKETNPKTILWLSCHNFIDPFCSDCQLMLQGKEMVVMFVSELKPIEMSFKVIGTGYSRKPQKLEQLPSCRNFHWKMYLFQKW